MEIKFNLFKNDKKGNDKAPDYRGNDMDKKHEVACWLKDDKNGNKYMSCVLKESSAKGSAPSHVPPVPPSNPDQVDDLPF